MALLRAELKRAFLQWLYDLVEDGTAPEVLATGETDMAIPDLVTALKAFQKQQAGALSTGKSSVGSSGFAHSTQWQGWSVLRAMNPEEVLALAQEYREVYADAKAALIAAGNATPSDSQILAGMMDDDRMIGASSVTKDFSQLRYGVG
jgi:hypothetical protein